MESRGHWCFKKTKRMLGSVHGMKIRTVHLICPFVE